MTSEQHKLSFDIFAAAVALPRHEREDFIRETCHGDELVLAYVCSLVRSDEAANEQAFLASAPDPLRRDERLGSSVGPYVLRDRIGEGGQGVVYLAVRQEDFKQRVALKILKRGLDTEDVIARFQEERQRLAALNHENIARLFAGGDTEDGVPYFALEYVHGKSITEYCTRKQLPPRAILVMFQKVCAAVSYVHGFGLIHRDLKPGNVLVTDDGTPKILDFGIAKALSPELSSAGSTTNDARQRLLSPRYGSPEQLSGDSAQEN